MAVTKVSLLALAFAVVNANPPGPLPPIDNGASTKDVLGDAEKSKVCANAASGTPLCAQAGPADSLCTKIATEASPGCTDASCSAAKVCSFTVAKPVQHPDKPGKAYVTDGVVPEYGVIFPCNNGPLVISVPKSEIGGAPAAPGGAPAAPGGAPAAPGGAPPATPAPGAPPAVPAGAPPAGAPQAVPATPAPPA